MMTKTTSAAEEADCMPAPPDKAHNRTNTRLKTTVVILALVAAGLALYQVTRPGAAGIAPNELYMPIVDPVLEPDRPDLIGDSLPEE